MLLLKKCFPEKYNPDKEKINGATHCAVGFNCLPGRFHFFAPVNIIKN